MVPRNWFAAVAVMAALFAAACSLQLDGESALPEATAPAAIELPATSSLAVGTLSDALSVMAQMPCSPLHPIGQPRWTSSWRSVST